MTATLTWPRVVARRLARHHLDEPADHGDAAAVVRAMCGAHAQVITAAELSIGLRMAGATRDDVQGALWRDHRLVKTIGPRGTIHLLPADDLATWTGALSAMPTDTALYRDQQFTAEETEELVAAMATVLAEGELTADELTDALVTATGRWAAEPSIEGFQQEWPRWRLALYPAARRGALCYGPNRGRTVTYTSPARWLPGFAPADGDTAVADLLHGYLHAYGPATTEEVARWLSVPKGWVADRIAALGDDVEEVDVDGRLGWVVAGDTAAPDEPPRGVRLLPYFDAYTVGCHPRDRVFPGPASERALAGGQAGNYPVLLVDGTVAGVWHLKRSGRRCAITVEPLAPLGAARTRALEEEVERVGAFFGGSASLTVGTVSVGAHA